MQTKINELIAKGVKIKNPQTLEIGPDVDTARIKPGVVIHSGCRIFGANTLIEEGAVLGFEGPATVNNCYVGPRVELNGGYFTEAVFLAGVKAGLGAHVRAGTIMEEESSIAHTVGLKQTILFPYVTLGSLINFCDCFMAGGTSRKNHSEVGSSYIHFNYTPSQHKATPSLMGDVPKGVMLKQRPIFLGGQGGMVGPCRISYGVTTAAGIIVRKNELHPDRLIFGYGSTDRTSAANPPSKGEFKVNKQLVKSNIIYLANLVALRYWYLYVRALFIGPLFSSELFQGLSYTLELAIAERILRLNQYLEAHLPEASTELLQKLNSIFVDKNISNEFDELYVEFKAKLDIINNYNFGYLAVISNLTNDTANLGVTWLEAIVNKVTNVALSVFPK